MSATPGVIVQSSIGGTGQATLTGTYVCSAGSTLVAVCGGPSGTSHNITDSVNGSTGWTQAIALTTVGGGGIRVFYRNNMAAGSTVVTDTYGASTAFTGLALFEVTSTSGFDKASVLNVQTSGTTRTSASTTPANPGLAIGFCYEDTQNNSITVDTGSGWAALTGTGVTAGKFWNFGGGSIFGLLESKSISAATSATTTGVNTGSTTGTAILIFGDAGNTLNAANLSYGLSMQAVALTASSPPTAFSLFANPLSYNLSVGDSLSEYQIEAANLSYALSMQAVTLTASGTGTAFTLSANNLSYALNLQSVTLIAGVPLPAITCTGGSFDSLTPMPGLML